MADAKHVTEGDSSPPRRRGDDASSLSSTEAQAGVKGIEAISKTWTRTSLAVAYVGFVHASFVFVFLPLCQSSHLTILLDDEVFPC